MKADLTEPLEEPEETNATDALSAFVSPKEEPKTVLENVPPAKDDKAADAESDEKVAADEGSPNHEETAHARWFQRHRCHDGLVTVNVEPRPLSSEYAVTLTVRNNSDEMAVISRIVFAPNDIVENVSTDYATRPFGVSTPDEFALAFVGADNQAKNKTDQGRYLRVLSDTLNVPQAEAADLRLAIENEEHIGYGLVGRLTLEYNTSESLDIENVSIAFIGKQKEE